MSQGIPDAHDHGTGARFGKYTIVRKIGAGAFGDVYEAILPGAMGFAKRVALKKVRSRVVRGDPRFVQSMINEARLGALLHHANIVDVIEFDRVGDHYYLAMEFVDGATLAEINRLCLTRGVLLPRFAAIDLMTQVCRGLHYAHELRDHDQRPLHLVHRDIKPSNLIVDRQGNARILDFGIAKATSNLYQTTDDNLVKGTLRYMSPEQVGGGTVLGPGSDIFSVGVVLFEVATGRGLFDATSVPELVSRIVSCDLEEPIAGAEAVFPGVGPVLARALAPHPEDRFADARGMADALRDLGRRYPPEVDMADVLAKLLPAVERTESRVIHNSDELDLDTEETQTGFTADRLDDGAPRPSIEPGDTSRGWLDFSRAFPSLSDGVGDREDTERVDAVARAGVVPASDPSTAPSRRSSRRPWVVGALVAAIGCVVALAVAVPWMDRGASEDGLAAVDAGPPPADRPASEVEAEPGGDPMTETEPVREAGSPPEPAREAGSPSEPAREAGSPSEPAREAGSPSGPVLEPAAEAAPAPAPVAGGEVRIEPPLPSPEPGTVSLYSRPWADIYVDGVRVKSDVRLREHALDGGRHTIRLVCPSRDNREKQFEFTVDGAPVQLGCWDFDAMTPCEP